MSGAVSVGIAAEAAATAEAFAAADAIYAGSTLAAGEIGSMGALDFAAGDLAAGALGAGEMVAGTAGNVAGDLASSTAALNPAADTVAGSGPAVTSSAASAPGVTDTAANAASKLAAVQPDYVAQGLEGPGVPGSQSAAGLPAPSATPATTAAKPGLIDSVMNWATKNPTLAAGAVQTVAGAAGGAGKAMVDQQTMQKKAQLDKQNQIELAQWQDQFNHGASAGPFNITPGSNTLTRSDGTPVYASGTGLINRVRG